jgi:fructose-1,6-bisphosphatase/sedoheptulose 1,7-bisphosphatase-like protein
MATPNQPQLSDSQLAELEKLARAQERSVDKLLSEAVDRYIRDKQWEVVKRYGIAKSRERGLTDGDVARLIAESRAERGR